jgi:hypothetical protein
MSAGIKRQISTIGSNIFEKHVGCATIRLRKGPGKRHTSAEGVVTHIPPEEQHVWMCCKCRTTTRLDRVRCRGCGHERCGKHEAIDTK